MNVRIIVGSSADFNEEIRDILTIVPMTVILGDTAYRGGIELSYMEFYKKLVESDVLPTTSQASPAEFAKVFEEVTKAGECAVVLCIASNLSGTYQSAKIGAEGAQALVDEGVSMGNELAIETQQNGGNAGIVRRAEILQENKRIRAEMYQAGQKGQNEVKRSVEEYLRRVGENGDVEALSTAVSNIVTGQASQADISLVAQSKNAQTAVELLTDSNLEAEEGGIEANLAKVSAERTVTDEVKKVTEGNNIQDPRVNTEAELVRDEYVEGIAQNDRLDYNVTTEDGNFSPIKIRYSPAGLKLPKNEFAKFNQSVSTDYRLPYKTHKGLQYQSCVFDDKHILYVYEDGGFGNYNPVARIDYANGDVVNTFIGVLENGEHYEITEAVNAILETSEVRQRGYSVYNAYTKKRRRSRGNGSLLAGTSESDTGRTDASSSGLAGNERGNEGRLGQDGQLSAQTLENGIQDISETTERNVTSEEVEKYVDDFENSRLATGAEIDTKLKNNIHTLIRKFKVQILFDDKVSANGKYENGVIWINPNSEKPIRNILFHEFTHHIENARLSYIEFMDSVIKSTVFKEWMQEKGYSSFEEISRHYLAQYNKKIDEINEQNRKEGKKEEKYIDNLGAKREVVANFVGDRLFNKNMPKAINAFVSEMREWGERIRDWLRKHKILKENTTNGALREIRQLEEMFSRALEKASEQKNNTTSGAQFSYGDIREQIAHQHLDELSERLGAEFPLSARFTETVKNNDTPLNDGKVITVVPNSVNKGSDSFYAAGRNAFNNAYKGIKRISVKQSGIEVEFDDKLVTESISKEVGDQSLIDAIPFLKELAENSILLGIERIKHTSFDKGTIAYKLYNTFSYGNEPYIITFNAVKGLTGNEKLYSFRNIDIKKVTGYRSALMPNGSASSALATDYISTVAELYDIVKQIPRDEGGLKYTQKEAEEYLFKYTESRRGKQYSFTIPTPKKQDADTTQLYKGKSLINDEQVYSYDFLTSLPNMQSVKLPDLSELKTDGKIDKTIVIRNGLNNAKSVGKENNGIITVKNRYTGNAIVVTTNAIRHGLNGGTRRLYTNARLGAVIGDIVKNSVPINALQNTAQNVSGTYAMAGYAYDSSGREFVVISTIEQRSDNLVDMEVYDITHAVSGRHKKSSQADTKSQGFNPSIATEISIAELIDFVNGTYQSILSEDVLETLGEVKNKEGYYTGKTLYSFTVPTPTKADADTTPQLERRQGRSRWGDSLSSFADSVEKSSWIDEELKERILSDEGIVSYNRIANADTLSEALDKLENGGAGETSRLTNLAYNKNAQVNETDVAELFILLEQYQAKGDYESSHRVVQVSKLGNN